MLGMRFDQIAQQGVKSFTDTVTPWQAFLGDMQGSMGETSTLAILIGATAFSRFRNTNPYTTTASEFIETRV